MGATTKYFNVAHSEIEVVLIKILENNVKIFFSNISENKQIGLYFLLKM